MEVKIRRPIGAYLTAVDMIGDIWTFLILREAFFGARRFGNFVKTLNISRARLTERLKHVVEAGILEKRQCSKSPQQHEYRLTKKGRAIYPIALTLIAWAEDWRAPQNAPKLIHQACRQVLKTKTVCQTCLGSIQHHDIEWPDLTPVKAANENSSNVRGWRRMSSFQSIPARPDPVLETLKAFGDRWSMLIMYKAQQGPFRFGEIHEKLGLSTNILTDRLKHLLKEGLLSRTGATRHAAYQATRSGYALLECMLAVRSWAIECETPREAGWSLLKHKVCGSDLSVICVCTKCELLINPTEISFENEFHFQP